MAKSRRTTGERLEQVARNVAAEYGNEPNDLPQKLMDEMRRMGFNQSAAVHMDDAIRTFRKLYPPFVPIEKLRQQAREKLLAEKKKLEDLHVASVTPIQQQLDELAAQEKAEEDERKRLLGFQMLRNIDLLLTMVPKHESNDCSDTKPTNLRYCGRCKLLEVKENSSWLQDWPWDECEPHLLIHFVN